MSPYLGSNGLTAAQSPVRALPGLPHSPTPHRPPAAELEPSPARRWRPAHRPAAAWPGRPIPDLSRRLATHGPRPLSRGRAHPEPMARHPPPGGRLAEAGPIPRRPRTSHHPVAAEPGSGPRKAMAHHQHAPAAEPGPRPSRTCRAPQPPTGLRPAADRDQPIGSPGAPLRGPPPQQAVAVEGRESRVAEGHRAATRPQGAPLTPGPEPPSSPTGRPPTRTTRPRARVCPSRTTHPRVRMFLP